MLPPKSCNPLRKNLIYIPEVDGPNPVITLPHSEEVLRSPLLVFVNSRSGGLVGTFVLQRQLINSQVENY